jgi:aryl-alcohol dehydrogenase-like predicted oxidoreductase
LHLQALQAEGKIRHIGVTNFDVLHLREILDAGVPVISNQVQYSALDRRPERGMVALCPQQGMSLLCYGTIAGGFLSDRYLGVAEPVPPLENRSLTKYKLIIDDFGGWDLFQALLATMRGIADKHSVSIAAVATRYVLQKPCVGGAIIGVRHMGHLPDTLRLWTFELTGEDLATITRITEEASGPEGDIYGVERVKSGKHAVIMHYNLNTQAKG